MSIEIEKTVTLLAPFEFNGVQYTEVRLEEPSIGQLKKAYKAGGGVDVVAALINIVGKMPMGAVDKIKHRDMEQCSDFFGQFSGNTMPLEEQTEYGD